MGPNQVIEAADAIDLTGNSTANDLICNSATGQLPYDIDGTGTQYEALPFATLTGAPAITANDFIVI